MTNRPKPKVRLDKRELLEHILEMGINYGGLADMMSNRGFITSERSIFNWNKNGWPIEKYNALVAVLDVYNGCFIEQQERGEK